MISFCKKWFTLFEMMIVIALIGLFVTTVSYMNQDARIDQTRAERLANTVYDQIRSARNNMIIGKWVLSGATTSFIIADERVVMISATGVTTSYAYNSSYTGTETRFPAPFFDSDPRYVISDIAISSGSLDTPDMTGVTIATITYRASWDIIIAASKGWVMIPSSSIRSLRIQTGYGNFSRYVTVDWVSGITEVLRLVDSGSTSGIPPPTPTTQSCALPWGGFISHGNTVGVYLSSSVPFGSTCTSESRLCTNWSPWGSYIESSCTVAAGTSCNVAPWWVISHGSSVTAYLTTSVVSPATCTSQSRACTNWFLWGTYANQACSVVATVNGSCSGTANTCIVWSPSGYSAGSCGWAQTWSCIGSGGWSTASCSIANAACPTCSNWSTNYPACDACPMSQAINWLTWQCDNYPTCNYGGGYFSCNIWYWVADPSSPILTVYPGSPGIPALAPANWASTRTLITYFCRKWWFTDQWCTASSTLTCNSNGAVINSLPECPYP